MKMKVTIMKMSINDSAKERKEKKERRLLMVSFSYYQSFLNIGVLFLTCHKEW